MILTDKLETKQSKLNRDSVRARINHRESDEDIREALQAQSASTYVFQVQDYQWEVQS